VLWLAVFVSVCLVAGYEHCGVYDWWHVCCVDFSFGDFSGIGLGWKGRMLEIKRQLDFQAKVVIVISVALFTF